MNCINQERKGHNGNSKENETVTVKNTGSVNYAREIIDDTREEKTVSYGEYQRQKRNTKESATVRLSEAQFDERIIDPVEIVLSEDENIFEKNEQKDIGNPGYMCYEKASQSQSRESSNNCLKPVGWLICVGGPNYGQSYPLSLGKNSIGRSSEMCVALKNDVEVSRKNHAWIEYREEERKFYVYIGTERKLVYKNDDLLLSSTVMEKNDVLYLGESALMLIPCCDEQFSWDNVQEG